MKKVIRIDTDQANVVWRNDLLGVYVIVRNYIQADYHDDWTKPIEELQEMARAAGIDVDAAPR
jgi:hypothetical protein